MFVSTRSPCRTTLPIVAPAKLETVAKWKVVKKCVLPKKPSMLMSRTVTELADVKQGLSWSILVLHNVHIEDAWISKLALSRGPPLRRAVIVLLQEDKVETKEGVHMELGPR